MGGMSAHINPSLCSHNPPLTPTTNQSVPAAACPGAAAAGETQREVTGRVNPPPLGRRCLGGGAGGRVCRSLVVFLRINKSLRGGRLRSDCVCSLLVSIYR